MEKIVIDRDRLTLSLANLLYFFNAMTYRKFFFFVTNQYHASLQDFNNDGDYLRLR
ncbi:MAG: hypothetical protein HOJ18_13395 [Rhodospirillaceae bacterium]|nr:hypothetical protein [Rhodospirillaceae bacterium]